MFLLNGFLYFITFLFWSYFFLWRSLFFSSAMRVTFDQYRACIGFFSSFRVIKCSDFFRASFFYYCLKFIMFSISWSFNHFSFSSVNSTAAEFQFFLHAFQLLYHHAIVGYWSQSWAGWVEELLICLSLKFK